MTIEELLKTTGATVTLGNCWLAWEGGEEGEWSVLQHLPHAKLPLRLYKGDLSDAIEILNKMGD